MEEFLKEATSLHWWIGVVIVGVLINIASAYIRRCLEYSLSTVSGYWRKKSEERVSRNSSKIELLKSNPELRIVFALRESRHRIRSFMFFIIGIALFILAKGAPEYVALFCEISGSITVLIGLHDHHCVMTVNYLVESSVEGLDKLDA